MKEDDYMYDKNPFTLMYGIPALSVISRDEQMNTILKSFLYNDYMYMYLITGIRGTGKTVLLRNVSEIISKNDDWLCIDINPQGKIIESLSNRLSDHSSMKKILDKWKLTIKLPYADLEKEKNEITDFELNSEKILEKLSKNNKKVLITIDEVNNTDEFKKFVNFYQSMIGKGIKLYLLMTGLIENVNSIINDKSMTFLSRAPKIELEPLSLPNIALEYKNIFSISDETSIKMAKLTNGYAFAYQVLGYLFYEDNTKILDESFINKYDSYLWKNGYNKFWSDLTKKEKEFVVAMAMSNNYTKEEIIKNLKNESTYSQYRRRLIEKGLIAMNAYNSLSFVLPRFKEYILFVKEF